MARQAFIAVVGVAALAYYCNEEYFFLDEKQECLYYDFDLVLWKV